MTVLVFSWLEYCWLDSRKSLWILKKPHESGFSLQKLPGFRLLIIQNKTCILGHSLFNWRFMQVIRANKDGFEIREDIHLDLAWLKLYTIRVLPLSKLNPLLRKYEFLVKKRYVSSLVLPLVQLKLNKFPCSLR